MTSLVSDIDRRAFDAMILEWDSSQKNNFPDIGKPVTNHEVICLSDSDDSIHCEPTPKIRNRKRINSKDLDDDERKKLEKKRASNRLATQKYNARQRILTKKIRERINHLQQIKATRQQEISQLESKIDLLHNILQTYDTVSIVEQPAELQVDQSAEYSVEHHTEYSVEYPVECPSEMPVEYPVCYPVEYPVEYQAEYPVE